jgi:hypothetical protein
VAADVFGLAATALFVITGTRPTLHSDQDLIFDKVPVTLRDAIRKGCAQDWRQRFGSVRELVDALHVKRPRLVLEQAFTLMRAAQGRACGSDIDRLAAKQVEAAAIVFTHADSPGVRRLWACPMSEIAPPSASPPEASSRHAGLARESPWESDGTALEACARRFLRIIADFRGSCGALCAKPDASYRDHLGVLNATLVKLFELSNGAEAGSLPADELLFVEYVFGLGYLEVFTHFGGLFIDWLEERRERAPDEGARCPECAVRHSPSSSYVDGLRSAFVVHDSAMNYLRTWYRARNREKVWSQVLSRWNELVRENPEVVGQIHRVVSLRRVPEGFPQVLTMAQVMHWEGWGGQGKLFRAFERYSRGPLARVLLEHESQAFDWHGLSASELHVNFSHRKNFFAAAAERLADYSAGTVAVLLSEPVLNGAGAAKERRVRIWGDAVGPKRITERRIMENVSLCGAHMNVSSTVRFELTLCDAAGPSLQVLAGLPTITWAQVEESRTYVWRDLNLPFPGEPSFDGGPGDQRDAMPPPPSSFDCYSCAISLHQIADRISESRHVRIREILAFATRIVRPGGVLAIPDVGHGVDLQVFLLPTNLVDREGGWGGDLFSLTAAGSGRRLHRFQDVASTLDGRFVCRMNPRERAAAGRELVKIPLPLIPLHRGSPAILAESGMAIYEALPYLVIDLPLNEVDRLDERWCAEVAQGRGSVLVRRMLKRWRPESVAAVRRTPNLVAQLGYELASRSHAPPPRAAGYLA